MTEKTDTHFRNLFLVRTLMTFFFMCQLKNQKKNKREKRTKGEKRGTKKPDMGPKRPWPIYEIINGVYSSEVLQLRH